MHVRTCLCGKNTGYKIEAFFTQFSFYVFFWKKRIASIRLNDTLSPSRGDLLSFLVRIHTWFGWLERGWFVLS
jgi:hypothetical protein